MMFRIAQEDPDLDGVPEGLADLVRHCLRKDPDARPGLDEILERIGAQDTVVDGRSRDPWLPSALVAQLGRHAVRLLDTENPDERPAPAPAPPAHQAAVPAPEPAQGSAAAALDLSKPSAAPTPTPAPEVAPEHTATPPPPGGPASTAHFPTLIAGAGQAPSPAAPPAAHPAYGHPQQHPNPTGPPAYGYPQGGWGAPGSYGPTPPYGPGMPTTPYGPTGVPEPEPPRRSGRSTAALIAVALVVALGAGGSVYALMQGGTAKGTDDAKASSPASTTPNAPNSPSSPPSSPSSPSSPSDSASPRTSQGGTIPEGFLGTWDASIDNATGHNTRQLTIQQGGVGDTVLSLVADGPSGSSTYHCVFRARLTAAPGGGGPLVIGPSEVTGGAPISSCSPGAASEITLLSDGRLRRVNTGSGESLTYTKSG
jgi:hypothetical protein